MPEEPLPAPRQERAERPPELASADEPPAPPTAPVTRPRRGLSPVWIIPIVAALLGLWLAYKHFSEKGPEVTVSFITAEGIIAGKTPVLVRNVNIGTVSKVELSKDRKAVLATLDMTREADDLLRTDTQIWVERPRYGGAGISGLGTIVSGSYLELQPGVARGAKHSFVGLENPPITPPGVPGLRLRLRASEGGGINPGSSILYKGFTVGKIETREFHPDEGRVEFGAFIQSEYAHLIDKDTRFWNFSGIDLQVGANGFSLRSGTLESLLSGGVTFSEPDKKRRDVQTVGSGASFPLYATYADAHREVLLPTLPYLLLFTESVRGLAVDAPVEFRGLRIGTVMGISFKYLPDDPEHRVPVLIKLDPTLLIDLPTDDFEATRGFIAKNVEKGLRASLKTGNLLTGQLYVDIDFQKDPPPASIVEMQGYYVLPTYGSGFAALEDKISGLLDKFKALPLEQTISNANDLLAQFKSVSQNLDKLLASQETQALPGTLRKDLGELQKTLSGYNSKSDFYTGLNGTLRQLDETLQSLRGLTDTLERHPNSIIFGKPGGVEPPKGSH